MYDHTELLDLYSGRGSQSHDPRLLLKFVLYQHALGNVKPGQWAENLIFDNKSQWLTFGMRVSRTAMYNFRDRMATIIEKLNDQVVRSSVDQGLIDPKRASLDGTYIAANASRNKLLNHRKVQQRLQWIYHELSRFDLTSWMCWAETTLDQEVRPAWLAPTEMGLRFQLRLYQKAKSKLQELSAKNAKRRSDKRKAEDKIVVSIADSDAVFGRDKDKVYRPLYNVQSVCDLDSDMTLAYEVFSQVSDSGTLPTMVDKLIDNHLSLQSLLADAGYPTGEDLAYCQRHSVALYAPWQENSFTARKRSSGEDEPFEQSDFHWDAVEKCYECPGGNRLSFSESKSRQRANGSRVRFELYRAESSACAACPLSGRCTTSARGRSVRRDLHQDSIDELKARMETVEAKLLYRHRGQTIERLFGDFKEHRGARRFSGRSIARARAQYGLTVLVHNLRIAHRLLKNKTQEEKCMKISKNAA